MLSIRQISGEALATLSEDEVLDIARIHGDSVKALKIHCQHLLACSGPAPSTYRLLLLREGQLLAERDGLTGLLSNLSGADLNLVIVPFSSPDEKTSRTFLEALYRNNVRELEKVLAVPVDPNHIFCEGTEEEDPALLIAAREGCSDVVQLLMEAMANLDHPDITGCTALWVACLNGNFEVVRLLLEYRADHGKACDGDTPLIVACSDGNEDIVKCLLEMRADCNQLDSRGNPPLAVAAISENSNLVSRLLEAGADVDHVNCDGESALWAASEQGQVEALGLLLEARAQVNRANREGHTPLLAAAAKGHPDIVAILLEAQADVNQADLHFGKTPLWMASYAGHLEIVNQLLDAAALLDMKDFMGCSPFEVATEQKHKRVAQLLLTSGFDKLPARSGPRTPSDGE